MALLAAACLFMAGLNLWLEFKTWFDKRYQRKDNPSVDIQKTEKKNIPNVIGKSKFNMKEEELRSKQRQAERDEKIAEEQNTPVHSMDLEMEKNPLSGYGGPITSEQEIILYSGYDKADRIIQTKEQSFTVDEFGLLATTLQGKPISPNEKIQVPEILQRVQGTNLYEQFLNQVDGAEGIAAAILSNAEDAKENITSIPVPGNLSKFIRT